MDRVVVQGDDTGALPAVTVGQDRRQPGQLVDEAQVASASYLPSSLLRLSKTKLGPAGSRGKRAPTTFTRRPSGASYETIIRSPMRAQV